ncbi:MAG: hypothetical protein R3F11_23155 [Verrucomicrobiales bacterium]
MNEKALSAADSSDSLESALDLFGGGHRAIRAEPPSAALRANRHSIQEQFERASTSQAIGVFDRSRFGAFLDSGGEHEVYLAEDISVPDRWRVYKKTHPDHAGQTARAVARIDGGIRVASDDATPAEYLERLILHNKIFGDEIRLEGLLQEGSSLSIVTSQPYIKGLIPERSEVDDLLAGSGFRRMQDGFWFSQERQVGIVDTKPANFIRSDDGAIHPIDVVIFIPTEAMLSLWNKRREG